MSKIFVSAEQLEEWVEAARLGYKHSIRLANGIILAAAYMHKAAIWTQGADFKGLRDVKYKEKA